MQSKRFKRIMTLVLSLCFVFSCALTPNSVYAKTTKQLNDRKAKIQQEIKKAQEEVNKLSKEKKETEEYVSALEKKITLKQDEINVLQKQVDSLQSKITKIEKEISQTEAKIEKTQREIDKKQAEFDQTYADYCQRLRAIYISGNASSLEVLLTCPDISSILTRSQMIRSVSKRDSNILDGLMKKMAEIEKDKADLEANINKLSEDKKELVKDKKELQSGLNEVAAAKKELDAEVAEANAVLKKLSGKRSEYMESILEDKKEIDKIDSEIKAQLAAAQRAQGGGNATTQIVSGGGNGTFRYPTDYRSVSSGFYRRSGAYHGALDFPCPTGSNVYAGAAGTVVTATYHYSYGYYVLISHGNSLSTLYAHNSQLLVSAGQHVARGQVIAKSGSTGNSTGPHCHFEVRVNGTRVNPSNYL